MATINNVLKRSGVYMLPLSHNFCGGYVSKEGNKIDYSQSKEIIRYEEKMLLSSILSLAPERILFLDQEHKDRILYVDSSMPADAYCAGAADALITNAEELCLVIRTADCVPIFLLDPVKKCIAAVHSGWRSSELDISGKSVKELVARFGSLPSDIIAYILPSIGPDSYEVGKDVAEKFPDKYVINNNRYFLDLWKTVEHSLFSAGITREHCFTTTECTVKSDRLFSHRKGDLGRTLNFIYVTRTACVTSKKQEPQS
jgi:polyphenol oxidase